MTCFRCSSVSGNGHAMIGTRSSVSLRFENFAGMVSPNDPIGPDGAGSAPAVELGPGEAGCAFAFSPPGVGTVPEVVRPCGPPTAFFDSWVAVGPPKVCASGRDAFGTLPTDGCFETGVSKARRASSGVGISVTLLDSNGTGSVAPGLIWPVLALKPGSVGTVALSSALARQFKVGTTITVATTAANLI